LAVVVLVVAPLVQPQLLMVGFLHLAQLLLLVVGLVEAQQQILLLVEQAVPVVAVVMALELVGVLYLLQMVGLETLQAQAHHKVIMVVQVESNQIMLVVVAEALVVRVETALPMVLAGLVVMVKHQHYLVHP
jgi:hypothetical protein